MGREGLLLIFLLLLPLALVWADPPTLNSISDLSNIEFGHRFPRHGLYLLYFIAHNLVVDNNDALVPMFIPDRGDWGFHFFSNFECVFPPLQDQNLQAYYAVGNLNTPTQYGLAPYVSQSYRYTPGNVERNRDRVVVRTSPNSPLLEALYITQHYPLNDPRSNQYDPANTWRISPALLREIRSVSANRMDGLAVFLYIAGYDVDSRSFNQFCYCSSSSTPIKTHQVEDAAGPRAHNESTAVKNRVTVSENNNHLECYAIVLQVKSTDNGYARIRWSNVPDSVLDLGVKVTLYNDDMWLAHSIGKSSYGTFDTNQYLNHGLSVSLQHMDDTYVIMSGPKFDDTDRKHPVDIQNYDASLQLYTINGYACARLFIKKTFTDWKVKFCNSWVGFYSNHNSVSSGYDTFYWSVYFNYQGESEKYDTYTYMSTMSIRPGAQARFFLNKDYDPSAQTIPWER
ncbi:hypothetical protein J4Q44_G00138190 [Coregonus suidteri]|uniref:Uncharacterized protein n=1 Tax=Coregonus suidteri TaxID=861788 RepID=A0AAN8QTS2_9TELE